MSRGRGRNAMGINVISITIVLRKKACIGVLHNI